MSCQTCRFYKNESNECTHKYWLLCIKRGDDGYVIEYSYYVPIITPICLDNSQPTSKQIAPDLNPG